MSPSAPYDLVYVAVLIVKQRVGDDIDSLQPLGGQVASNSQTFSQQCFNSGWRKLQQFLVSQGYERLKNQNTIISSLPAVSSVDTAIQVWISWTGYWDGETLYTGLALPQNLVRPISVKSRISATDPNQSTTFNDVDLNNFEQLPSVPKKQWNEIAVWNNDQLAMLGATTVTDLRVDFMAYFGDFLDTGNLQAAVGFTPWYLQAIPILRAAEPLAMYALAEIEIARGNQDAAVAYINAGQESATEGILGRLANAA